jgi:hypothetical protein
LAKDKKNVLGICVASSQCFMDVAFNQRKNSLTCARAKNLILAEQQRETKGSKVKGKKLKVVFVDIENKKTMHGIDEAEPNELCEGIEDLSHELKERLEKLLK